MTADAAAELSHNTPAERAPATSREATVEFRRRSIGPPAARSVLLTVLGEYVMPNGGSAWQETLVGALTALGHSPQTARQAVARSTRDGWLVSERTGRRTRMRVTPHTAQLLEEGRVQIFGFGEAKGWDGRWLVVVVRVPEGRRQLSHHVRTRLGRAGMGSLGGGVWIAPRIERERSIAELLRTLGHDVEGLSFHAAAGDIGDVQELVGAWRLDTLAGQYDQFVQRYRRLRPQESKTVFRVQTELVHAWRKLAFLDPDLPTELLPRDWPRPRAYELFHQRHASWDAGAQRYFATLDEAAAP